MNRPLNPTIRILGLAAALVLGLAGLVYLDGLVGVNHLHSLQFQWHARHWSLRSLGATQERVAGAVAGLRVKAVLELSRDIPLNTAVGRAAAGMPFGLDPALSGVPKGRAAFLRGDVRVTRQDGLAVPAHNGHAWHPAGHLTRGAYVVEQVFWLPGLPRIHGDVLAAPSEAYRVNTSSAYFKAHNATPYRDPSQHCRDHSADAAVAGLATLDRQAAQIQARTGFFNGDRLRFVYDVDATGFRPTAFVYDHQAWTKHLDQPDTPDCAVVIAQGAAELARLRAQLDALEAVRLELAEQLSWAEVQATSSPIQLSTDDAAKSVVQRQLGPVECPAEGACRPPGLGCEVVVYGEPRAVFLPGRAYDGIVHAIGPLDTSSNLRLAPRGDHFLFQPTRPDEHPGVCLVLWSQARLVDPAALTRSTPARLTCRDSDCRVSVAQWERDPAWTQATAKRVPELRQRLAELETTVRSAQ